MKQRSNRTFWKEVVLAFITLGALSCGFHLGEEEIYATDYDRFRIAISCKPGGVDSYSQYLMVEHGGSAIFRTYTREFDRFEDCARSVKGVQVLDRSTIELTYYDGPRRFSADVMRAFEDKSVE